MKAPKYNKSNVMKMAWSMFRKGKKIGRHVLSFVECLKEAWKLERASFEKAMKMFKRWNKVAEDSKKENERIQTSTCSLSFMSDTLVNYYANNTYNGD